MGFTYIAKWRPGGTTVDIYDMDGHGVGGFSMPPIVCAACLGPRFFAFNCNDGCTCIIDAETNRFTVV